MENMKDEFLFKRLLTVNKRTRCANCIEDNSKIASIGAMYSCECGEKHGSMYVGETCEKCNTKVSFRGDVSHRGGIFTSN